MNRTQFADLVHAFLTRHKPGRHLYIWHGREQDLLALLPQSNVHRLSIFDSFANSSDLPTSDEESRSQLRRLIGQTLTDLASNDTGDPQILVVTGSSLLARYGGANLFFDFVSDRRMVVLQLNADTVDTETITHLPEYVLFRPAVELETLRRILERSDNLVSEE